MAVVHGEAFGREDVATKDAVGYVDRLGTGDTDDADGTSGGSGRSADGHRE